MKSYGIGVVPEFLVEQLTILVVVETLLLLLAFALEPVLVEEHPEFWQGSSLRNPAARVFFATAAMTTAVAFVVVVVRQLDCCCSAYHHHHASSLSSTKRTHAETNKRQSRARRQHPTVWPIAGDAGCCVTMPSTTSAGGGGSCCCARHHHRWEIVDVASPLFQYSILLRLFYCAVPVVDEMFRLLLYIIRVVNVLVAKCNGRRGRGCEMREMILPRRKNTRRAGVSTDGIIIGRIFQIGRTSDMAYRSYR